MDNPSRNEQIADGGLLTVFADSDEVEDDGDTIENAAPEAFEAAGEDSDEDNDAGPEDEEDEEDEDEDDEDDEDSEDFVAENETVPSSETDFSGETPL